MPQKNYKSRRAFELRKKYEAGRNADYQATQAKRKREERLKDKKPLIALGLLLSLGTIGVTLAYYSDTTILSTASSTSSFGVRTDYSVDVYDNLSPGETMTRSFTTTNVGNLDVAVRYTFVAQWTDKDGNLIPIGVEVPSIQYPNALDKAMGISVPINTSPTNVPGYGPVLAWYSGASTRYYYCADQVMIEHPETYTCEHETADPTEAYSLIAGPYYYFKRLGARERTYGELLEPLVFDARVGDIKTTTWEACNYSSLANSDMDMGQDCSGDHSESPWYSGTGEDFLNYGIRSLGSMTTLYDNPFASGFYRFTLAAETVEYNQRVDLWGDDADAILRM